MAIGLGPVFESEWLTTSRKWQVYALRSLFVGVILVGMAFVYVNSPRNTALSVLQAQALFGRFLYQTIALSQLVLVLLAAPAATAGAVCVDKARGTLMHVLMTDLSNSEIVLGKLAARLTPILGMILCTLPVVALGSWLGGIDPVLATGAFLIAIGSAVLTCSLALFISIWGTKLHEVLMATFLIILLWIAGLPAVIELTSMAIRGMHVSFNRGWLLLMNPFVLITEGGWDSQSPSIVPAALYLAACLVLSAALWALSILCVRAVAIKQASRGHRASKSRDARWMPKIPAVRWTRWFPGPSLDGNPIAWRQWHYQRPSRWSRVVWTLYAVVAGGLTLFVVFDAVTGRAQLRDFGGVLNGVVVAAGLLLLSVSASSALAEERLRGSLDVLLATPLSTREIVWGKWLGAFRSVPPLALMPFALITACSFRMGHLFAPPLLTALVLAHGAAVTSFGLALATWNKQLGRCVAISVVTFLAITIGAIPLGFAIAPGTEIGVSPIASASSFWGIGFFTALSGGRGGSQSEWPALAVCNFFWTIAYATIAVLLYQATLRSFDRCMGRMRETLAPPPSRECEPPRLDDFAPEYAKNARSVEHPDFEPPVDPILKKGLF